MSRKLRIVISIAFGIAVGVVLVWTTLALAGAGHGTMLPMVLTMGPLAVITPLAAIDPTVGNIVMFVVLLLTPPLYAAYSVLVIETDDSARRRRRLARLAVIHYACVVLMMAVSWATGSMLAGIDEAVRHAGGALVLFVRVFLALHVAALVAVRD